MIKLPTKRAYRYPKIFIAEGEAEDTMSRGSFRHRDRISNRRRLKVTEKIRDDGAVELTLKDPKTGATASGMIEDVSEDKIKCGIRRISIDTEPFGTNRLELVLPAAKGESRYGCGETFSEFDLNGHLCRIWTAEHQNSRLIKGKMIREKIFGKRPGFKLPFEQYETYYAQPTFVTGGREFVHADGCGYMEMDFRKPHETSISVRGNTDIYLGKAGSFEDLSAGLSSLVGVQPPMPGYVHDGIILASQRGSGVMMDKLAAADRHSIPVVGFWCQDWCGCRETKFGYQVMWNWQFDSALYPDLPATIADLKKRGIRFFGYINPFMAIEGPVYKEASAKGYCVKDREGNDYMVTITTFPAAMIDLTNPDAREWYKKIIKENMIGIGMSGWMADFGEYLPTDAVLFSGADAEEMHNPWPAMWARLNREAVDEAGMRDEIFFFMRAGHTGSVKCAPMMWNGDQHTDWSVDLGIGSVIPAALSLSMSGMGLCHSDIGGYTTNEHMKRSRELMMRWCEMSCFSPMMRMHEGNRPWENVQFDADDVLMDHIARMTDLHVAMKPYLENAYDEYYKRGIPVMRPLFYHYDDDGLGGIDDEYLLGRDILAAPVLNKGTESRECVLPDDEWIHLFTGESFAGGKFTVDAPIGRPPVFIRKESVYAEGLLLRFMGQEI